MTDAITYQTYHDKMAAMMDAAFPGRAGLVQAGVDDVASHLAPVDPGAPPNALVVFPEDTGLLAAFVGTRGATARQQTGTTLAIVYLVTSYDSQINYYKAKFPGQPVIRNLVLALTATFYRAVYETCRELAMTHGVYLAVGTNMAPARRVEEADEPDVVAALRDPDEPGRTYAYEAVAPFAPNTTLVFAPDGEVLVGDGSGGTLRAPSQTAGVIPGSTSKAYLVPIEEPPPGNLAGLSLSFNPVRNQEVLDTPVGRLGIVISKDAWMVDVNDRYVAKGANVILQPEAFDSWAFITTEWSPDVFREGGLANLQKNPEWVANVDPDLTGNLFEITSTAEPIIGRKQKTPPGRGQRRIGRISDTRAPPPGRPDPASRTRAHAAAVRRLVGRGFLVPGACVRRRSRRRMQNGYREAWGPTPRADVADDERTRSDARATARVRRRGARERLRGGRGRAARAAHRGPRHAPRLRRVA